MGKIKLGFVGACGFMGQTTHLHAFSSLTDECEVVAAVGNRERLLNIVSDRFGIRKRYRSLEQLCEDEEVDAVIVSLPPEWNLAVVCKLLSYGKHVMCEKPIALSVDGARKMVEAADKSGCILMVAYMKRYDPGVQVALKLFEDWKATGEMGNLLYARAHCFIGGQWTAGRELIAPVMRTDEPYGQMPEKEPPPSWLPEELRKNFYGHQNPYYNFLHVYCHDINLMRTFLGDDWCVVGVNLKHSVRVAMFEFSGVPALLEVGGPVKHYSFDEHMELYFERGSMRIETPPPLLAQAPANVVVQDGVKRQTLNLHADWDWSFRRQAMHFLECVRERKQPITNAQDALRDVEVVETLFKTHLGIRGD